MFALLPVNDLLRCEQVSRRLQSVIRSKRDSLRKKADWSLELFAENTVISVTQGRPLKRVRIRVRSKYVADNFLSSRLGVQEWEPTGSRSVPQEATHLLRLFARNFVVNRLYLTNVDGEELLEQVSVSPSIHRIVIDENRLPRKTDRLSRQFFHVLCRTRLFMLTIVVDQLLLDLDDAVLLLLKDIPRMTIRGRTSVSLQGIRALIEEWRRGEAGTELLRIGVLRSEKNESKDDVIEALADAEREGPHLHPVIRKEKGNEMLRVLDPVPLLRSHWLLDLTHRDILRRSSNTE